MGREQSNPRRSLHARQIGLPCLRPARLFRSSSELDLGHAHHVIFRSAGGSDELFNRALLCAWCHEDVTRNRLDCEGEAEKMLVFRRRDNHGTITDEWWSACPNAVTHGSEV